MGKRLQKVSVSELQLSTEVEHSIGKTLSEESSSEQALRKKVRGPTKKQDIWDLESNEGILVTCNKNGQPVGYEGSQLTSFLGTLVKMSQHVAIDCKDWRKFSKDKIDDLWTIVKGKFSFAPVETEEIRKWVISDMASKLKSWKYELKRQSYDPSLTVDQIVAAQTDSRVNKVQFKNLVTSWFEEKTQVVSVKKKNYRSKSNEPHVTGTKSFARLIHEETQKNNGDPPSRGSIYIISRTRKDGTIVNGPAAEVVDKLKSNTDESSSTTFDWRNDDLAKIKGPDRGGRIRCVGKVVMAKNKTSCSSQDPQVPVLKARINDLEGEMKVMKERREAEVKGMKEMKQKQEDEMKKLIKHQEAMVQFMTIVKDQLPNANFSDLFSDLSTQVVNDSCGAYSHCSSGKSTSYRGSKAHNSGRNFS